MNDQDKRAVEGMQQESAKGRLLPLSVTKEEILP